MLTRTHHVHLLHYKYCYWIHSCGLLRPVLQRVPLSNMLRLVLVELSCRFWGLE